MTESGITEAATVQFPMVRHAAEIGWTPLTPQQALTLRGDTSSMLLRGELEAALRRFNPWMTDDAVRSAVERLEALPLTIEGNRDVLAWAARRAAGLRRSRAASPHRPDHRLRQAERQCLARHLGMDGQAPGSQGQPRGRHVCRQWRAGRHRRTQKPDRP